MKKNIIFLLFVISLLLLSGYKTYSYFTANISVNVSSNSSNMICDAEILNVTSQEGSIYGYSEFKVRVKNYDSLDNVSEEKFNYVLSIENSNTSNALFSNNGDFSSNLIINGSINSNSKKNDDYIIQVKSNNGLSENIDYKVNLNCIQIN